MAKASKTKAIKAKKVNYSAKPVKAIAKKQTKSQILQAIAGETGLSMRQIKDVFTAAGYIARCHLTRKGSGEFSIPEMAIKAVRKTKAATKARPGRNPLTGETITISAKPKREIIRCRPLKSLKEVVA